MTSTSTDLIKAIRDRLYAGFPEFPLPDRDEDLPAYLDILAGNWLQMVTLTRVTYDHLAQLDAALRASFPTQQPAETDPA